MHMPPDEYVRRYGPVVARTFTRAVPGDIILGQDHGRVLLWMLTLDVNAWQAVPIIGDLPSTTGWLRVPTDDGLKIVYPRDGAASMSGWTVQPVIFPTQITIVEGFMAGARGDGDTGRSRGEALRARHDRLDLLRRVNERAAYLQTVCRDHGRYDGGGFAVKRAPAKADRLGRIDPGNRDDFVRQRRR